MIPLKIDAAGQRLWERKKASLKERFPRLMEEDLAFDAAQQDEFFLHLEEKLGITVAELVVLTGKQRNGRI